MLLFSKRTEYASKKATAKMEKEKKNTSEKREKSRRNIEEHTPVKCENADFIKHFLPYNKEGKKLIRPPTAIDFLHANWTLSYKMTLRKI